MSSKHLLLVFLVIFGWGMAQGQVFLPKRCYMHLSGRINDTSEITLNLVKIYDSLYADLVFSDDSCAHIVLGGNIGADGSFRLLHPFCDSSMQFTGKFVTRKTINGTIGPIDLTDTNGISFVLVETYPDGSLPLMVYYNHDSTKVSVGKNTAIATIQQCMILPGASGNPIISDTLRRSINTCYQTKKQDLVPPKALMDSLKKQFVANFKESTEPLLKSFPDAGNVNWTLWKFMHILYNDRGIISCYTQNYGYTGGAHGLETSEHQVISLKDGKPVKLNDLFVTGYSSSLSKLITKKLKETLQLSQEEKLTDHGYYEEKIPPSNNFYLLGNGIGFYYNHYEIAPYVNGPTDIFIPFAELIPIINNQGLIGNWPEVR